MVAQGWRLGGIYMRFRRSRVRGSSALAVVGGCLGVYVVLATGFHWLVEPTLGKNQGVAAYDPAPARIAPTPSSSVAPSVRPEPASRVASKPAASTIVRATGPASTEAVRAEPASRAAPRPMMTVVTKPAPTETARAESPSRTAPPMMTIATKPASTEIAPVASEQPTSGAIAAAESTETAPAPAAKKPHNKRKTVRHDRPREFFNPLNFFAWGSANGARRAF